MKSLTLRYWKSPFAYCQVTVTSDYMDDEALLKATWNFLYEKGYRPPTIWEWWRWPIWEDRPPAGFKPSLPDPAHDIKRQAEIIPIRKKQA